MRFVRACPAGILTLSIACAGCSAEDGGASPAGSGGAGGGTGGGVAGSGAGGAGASSGGASSSGGSAGAGQGSGGSAGAGGSVGSGGSGASSGSGGSGGGVESCPAPPAGVSPASIAALDAVNTLRVAMGIPCMELVPELNLSAQRHCDYYAANLDDEECIADAHGEVEGCTGFVADSIGQRMQAAGYSGKGGWSEVMAFQNDPEQAVAMSINSVYHRTPLLSPWYRHMGYGGAEECDTIDLGTGPETPDDVTGVYPYPGQTGVPLEFHGNREGPEPEEPPTGWPSAAPIHVYARDFEVQSYSIAVGGGSPLATTLPGNPGSSQFIFYANTPFESQTTYRVQVSGTRGGEPLSFDWTFTSE